MTHLQKQETSNKNMPTAVDYMDSYKGQGSPSPLKITGCVIGLATPYMIYIALGLSNDKASSTNESTAVDNVLSLLQSMIFVAALFFSEFLFGVMARSKSPKCTFSPVASQASNHQSFELIEANRIHQNHIESACIYIPASLSAAAIGVNGTVLTATTVTWVLGRLVYRYGYRQRVYPLWRVVGLEMSLTQSLICFGAFAYMKYKSS